MFPFLGIMALRFQLRCSDPHDLATIETTRVVPVDLNCFVYHMELTIADLAELSGLLDEANKFKRRAAKRRRGIEALMWNDEASAWYDLTLRPLAGNSSYASSQRQGCYVSNFTPLWVHAFEDSDRAGRAAWSLCHSGLLCPGKLVYALLRLKETDQSLQSGSLLQGELRPLW